MRKYDLVLQQLRGEIPILNQKALPPGVASTAINCDFRGGTIRSLPKYVKDTISVSDKASLFFLAGSKAGSKKAYLCSEDFTGAPTTAYDEQELETPEYDNVIFVFNNGTGPKKSTKKKITSGTAAGYYTNIETAKTLGVPKPSAPLEVEKIPTYTDFDESKIYYEGDIFNLEDEMTDIFTKALWVCIVQSTRGALIKDDGTFGTYSHTKSESDWTHIHRIDSGTPYDIRDELSKSTEPNYEARSHEKLWPINESIEYTSENFGNNTVKNTGDQVLKKGDLLQHTDDAVYRARFDHINRTGPDDPHVWTYSGMDMTDLLTHARDTDDYDIRLYGEDKVYARGDMVLLEYGTLKGTSEPLYFMFVCNVDNTQGVSPLASMTPGEGRWGIVCFWSEEDKFDNFAMEWDSDNGFLYQSEIKEPDGTQIDTDGYILYPYFATYDAGGEYAWLACYPYVAKGGDVRLGIFGATSASEGIRPFNPEWGGKNPWEKYKTAEEVAVNRTKVYDTVSYTWTWVTEWGEESEPAEATDVQDAMMSEIMEISLPVTSPPSSDITHFRIYRLSSGWQSSEFLYFPPADEHNPDDEDSDYYEGFPVSVLGDSIEDVDKYRSHIRVVGDLGEPIATEGWTAPSDNLRGFVSLANGCLAGFDEGNKVYFSEPWIYYAYPTKYQVMTKSALVGLGAFQNTVVACTAAHPEIINCPLPSQVSMVTAPHPQPCKSAKSIVSAENSVLYAGHNGLIQVGQDAVPINMTKDIIGERVWREEYQPSLISGAYFDGLYWGVIQGTDQGFVIPFSRPEHITQLDLSGAGIGSVKDVVSDPYSGVMYIVGSSGSSVTVLRFSTLDGTQYLPWTWTSGVHFLEHYVGHSAVRIDGELDADNSVEFSLYGDDMDTAKYTSTFTSIDPKRLPAGRYKELKISMTGTGSAEVRVVHLSTSLARM